MAGCQRGLSLSKLATHGYNNVIYYKSWSTMMVLINIDSLMRGTVWGKLYRPPSQLLFAQQHSSIDSQLFVENRDLCLPYTCIRHHGATTRHTGTATAPLATSMTTCPLQDRRPGFPVLGWPGTWLPGRGPSTRRQRQRSPRRLRSADTATCVTRRTSNIFGDRCFAAAGPRLWNSLSINLRQCHSLEQFKRLLKTLLSSA